MLRLLKVWGLPLSVTFFTALMCFLFFTPKVKREQQLDKCIINISIPGNIKYWINCDSPEFMRLAKDPSGLLERENTRQARPGLVILAYLLKFPLTIILKPIDNISDKLILKHPHLDEERFNFLKNNSKEFLSIYFSYISINIIVLFISLFIFIYFLSPYIFSWSLLFIFSLLAFNPLIKAFFLSPHTQMFNIAYPLLSVMLMIRSLQGQFLNLKWVVGIYVILGFCMLIYSSCFAILPCMIIGSIIYCIQNYKIYLIKNILINSILAFILISLPTILWMLYVIYVNGTFYNHEIEACNQLVWLQNAFNRGLGDFISTVFNNLHIFGIQTLIELKPALFLFGLGIVGAYIFNFNSKKFISNNKNLIISCMTSSIMFFLFYYLVGIYPWRIALIAMPPILLLGAKLYLEINKSAQPFQQKILFGGLCIIIGYLNISYVIQAGPYG